jgi:hypothetical protein
VSILHVPVTASNQTEWVRRAAGAINQLIGKRLNIVSKSAAYTLVDGDDVCLGDATGAAFSVTLPAVALYTGRVFIVKKIDASANAVTIDGNGAETIDGAATVALATQYESRTLLAGTTGWHII